MLKHELCCCQRCREVKLCIHQYKASVCSLDTEMKKVLEKLTSANDEKVQYDVAASLTHLNIFIVSHLVFIYRSEG